MKRIILILAALALSVAALAQAQITTKKMKIADFQTKTTKVVLTGNMMYDGNFQNKVKDSWTISPFEFCTLDEFKTLKSNPEYYFLIKVKGQFENEVQPGLEMLALVKGGIGAAEGIDGMYEVMTIPFRPADDHSGREFAFLPAILDIIQHHVLESMERDLEGYSGLSNYTLNLPKTKDLKVVYAEEDLASEVSSASKALYLKEGMEVVDADDADDYMYDAAEGTVVAYVVAPTEPVQGSFCYKMLIGADNHQLYYFKKHKITKKFGPGFLNEDLKRIANVRQ